MGLNGTSFGFTLHYSSNNDARDFFMNIHKLSEYSHSEAPIQLLSIFKTDFLLICRNSPYILHEFSN